MITIAILLVATLFGQVVTQILSDSAEPAFQNSMCLKYKWKNVHEACRWKFTVLVWMKNGCAENHFDLDSAKNKNKVSPNNKKKLNKDYLLFCFFCCCCFFSLFSFQESNITKFLENSFNVVGKKSQQIFHTTVDQFHQENWTLWIAWLLLLSRLWIFLTFLRDITDDWLNGKMQIITTYRVQFSACFKSRKSSQLR